MLITHSTKSLVNGSVAGVKTSLVYTGAHIMKRLHYNLILLNLAFQKSQYKNFDINLLKSFSHIGE